MKGVLERHDWLTVSPEVEAWLARAVTGWVGRVPAGATASGIHLEAIAGELPEASRRSPRRPASAALPFTREVAAELLELPGARLDPRALRCATRLQVGDVPAPATLVYPRASASRASGSTSTGTRTRCRRSSRCRLETHRRTLPIDPYLLEPLEHYLRTFDVDVAPNARVALEHRAGARAAIEDVRRSRAHDGPCWTIEARLGGELQPFQRAGVRYALEARRAFLADEQGLGKTVQALAALEADDAYPAIVVCPASLKLNWLRETAHWLPHRSVTVVSGTAARSPSGRDHDPQLRDRPRAPAGWSCAARRRSSSTSRTTSRTRAPSARRRCAGSPSRWRRTRCASRSPARRS